MSVLLVNNEVKEINEQVSKIEQTALSLDIKDDSSLSMASDALGWIAKTKKALEEKRKFFVQPLNDQVKKINDMFKGYSEPLEKADSILRGKVMGYRQEQERIRREEEERLRKLAEKEQKRLEKLAEKNNTVAPPPIPIPVMPQQPKTVESNLASVSAKVVWEFEIVDENKIPREFMIPNEKAIRAAVKAGVRSINGVKIYQTEQLAVRGR
jgi:hypothetical protein